MEPETKHEVVEAFRLESIVIVGGDIEATVLQIALSHRGLQYQVAWWDGRSRHVEWVDACEVTACASKERSFIGLR